MYIRVIAEKMVEELEMNLIFTSYNRDHLFSLCLVYYNSEIILNFYQEYAITIIVRHYLEKRNANRFSNKAKSGTPDYLNLKSLLRNP